VSARDLVFLALYAGIAALGLYLIAAPRRLFTRADEPARYRPEAVEYDSAQGRWLRRTAGPILVVAGLALILVRLVSQ
jgi:hypothetical protein